MNYILDTNILIAILHRKEPVNTVIRTKNPKNLFLTGITIGEIYFGIEKSSPAHIQKNRMAREALLAQFEHVYMDREIAEIYGKIKTELNSKNHYLPNNENDLWIAAHARAKSYTLVTENLKDFQNIMGLTIESWSVNPPTQIQSL